MKGKCFLEVSCSTCKTSPRMVVLTAVLLRDSPSGACAIGDAGCICVCEASACPPRGVCFRAVPKEMLVHVSTKDNICLLSS